MRASARAGPRPGAAVLAAFGLDGEPVPLAGGQGTSWRVGPVVLKPSDLPLPVLEWQAELLGRLDGRGELRVSPPLRTPDGHATRLGWTAWRLEPGEHLSGRWQDIVEVGERLHAALRDEPRPDHLPARDDVWALADRVAWQELAPPDRPTLPHVDVLLRALRPVDGVAQLVHGDLTGNVLFHPGLPPLVIDLSPYWRPPSFASAVVVVDALVHEGAGPELAQCRAGDPSFPQHLLRALVFRIVADHLAPPRRQHDGRDDPYAPVVALALRLAEAPDRRDRRQPPDSCALDDAEVTPT